MFKTLMLIYYAGMWGYTPPTVETQLVSSAQCQAVKEQLSDDARFVILCIDGQGKQY